ncbi:hypothetical protein IAR55_006909 [Kwoniella newhampshirensis]|uniref:Anaphase-promoting complex subunit 13 n=1 Tax=Kwoniella newhampshirensis TaxID=1651941 RepID=A0AAW0YGT3_9TREE
MMLDSSFTPLPTLTPQTLYSFYPHPLSPRSHLHSTLFSPSGESESGPGPSTQKSTLLKQQQRECAAPQCRPQTHHERTRRSDVHGAMKRAEERALMGRRPAGVGLGKDDEEIIVEEDLLEHEQHDTNMFGHRFLLPFGRRLTQMEMDAAPSPSPSEPDHERRQEDRSGPGGVSPISPVVGVGATGLDDLDDEDGGGAGIVDLDASIEDMDRSEGADGDDGGEGEESMEE